MQEIRDEIEGLKNEKDEMEKKLEEMRKECLNQVSNLKKANS